ncbi:MAG: hypothetical protein NXI04_30110 [Planctomycetaceae bacterium]|nr:hypothetical protein [Planctomycetaceae bacterium]
MNSKSTTVQFEINPHGCPVVEIPEHAFAAARFSPADDDQPRNQITIEANRNGLVALARWMIALADNDVATDHQHFDNDVDFGMFKSGDDVELIIQRVGK